MDIHQFGKLVLEEIPTLEPMQVSKIATIAIKYKYDKLDKGKPPIEKNKK